MKKIIAVLLALLLLTGPAMALDTLEDDDITISAPAAVLMEKTTGTVLYEKDAHTHYSPASVTKIMTMLLIVEALESGAITKEQMVTTSAQAASMGGSQIWLEEGESMSVSEMLKCVAVVSANDCAVALAELLCGTEEAFVKRMNEYAAELGMKDTHFTNCTGLLDDDDHYTCAYDIAVMSRELIKHDLIKEYTTIWMDKVRNGEFGLSNTNKLIFYYDGATGLKTGFTTKAMYCLSATAERDGVEYIAVVLHAPTSQDRFESAKTLLSYAFANYSLVALRPNEAIPAVKVELGTEDSVQPVYDGSEYSVWEKGKSTNLQYDVELDKSVKAPVTEGQQLGMVTVRSGDTVIAKVPLVSDRSVDRIGYWQIYLSQLLGIFGLKRA